MSNRVYKPIKPEEKRKKDLTWLLEDIRTYLDVMTRHIWLISEEEEESGEFFDALSKACDGIEMAIDEIDEALYELEEKDGR